MITNDNVQRFTDDYKLILTPVIKSNDPNKDKKPETKKVSGVMIGHFMNYLQLNV